MLHVLLMGFLLGLGAAIPIGPINLEIIRRNLQQGTVAGWVFGMGAASADVVYLGLLFFGTVTLLTSPLSLKIIGILGSFILAYFGYKAWQSSSLMTEHTTLEKKIPLSRQFFSGLFLTLFNPLTIIFWSSISSQVATLTHGHVTSIALAGLGVILGTVGWGTLLNLFLHMTKHKLSHRMIYLFNKIGGIILISFALFGFYHAVA